MRAGRLRDKVTIQIASRTQGEYEDLETWSTHAVRRCAINPLRASNYYQGAGENIDAVYEIRFRYEAGLFNESKMRLLDARVSPNRIFDNIVVIDTGNRHREIVITATERRWPTRA